MMNLQGWREWLRSDKGIALALFVALSSIYFATITGVTSSNDGSHYAATRAIVETGTFEISPYRSFAEGLDIAKYNGRSFSDRAPATALTAAATYTLGRVLPPQIVLLPSKHDPDNPRLVYAVMAATLLMSGAVILFYLSLRRHFEISSTGALLASLALGLGTTYWKYGSLLFSHAATAFLVGAALFLIFEVERLERPSPLHWLGIGAAMGLSVLAEYPNAIFLAITGVYVVVRFGPGFAASMRSGVARNAQLARLGALAAGVLAPLIFLLIYNTINFGGPLELSQFKVDTERWPAEQSIVTKFSTPILEGMSGLLLYGSDNQGLFLISPIALLGLPGWIALFRNQRRRAILIAAIWLAQFLVVSTHHVFNPFTNDSRYLTSFMALWFVPVALWLDQHVAGKSLNTPLAVLFALAIFGLFLLSVRNQFMTIAFSWNHDLDLTLLKRDAIPPENVTLVFNTVFRNILNLPLLWLVEALAALAVIGVNVLVRRFAPPVVRPDQPTDVPA